MSIVVIIIIILIILKISLMFCAFRRPGTISILSLLCLSIILDGLSQCIYLSSELICFSISRERERMIAVDIRGFCLSFFLLLSSMGVFVKIGFFSIGMPTSSLLLLLLLSCQLSFYTCSLQFRKDLSFLFFSYSILLIVTCIYLRCCPTAVFTMLFFF